MTAIARVSAGLLLLGIMVLVVSGWGITQTGVIYSLSHGLIDRGSANAIHRASNLPVSFFFLVHIMANIKVLLYRRRPTENWLINGLLIGLAAAVLAAVADMEYFRQGG